MKKLILLEAYQDGNGILIEDVVDLASIENEIVENTQDKTNKKNYYIKGIYMQSEKKNHNGRIYPRLTLGKEVSSYVKNMIETGRSAGELGHPDTIGLNEDRISHRITKLDWRGNDVYGEAIIGEKTPCGRIVIGWMDMGLKHGMSSRGSGTVSESIVQDDYYLSTVDIVTSPSAPDAWTTTVMEGNNQYWLHDKGVNAELIEKYKKKIESLTQKQLQDGIVKVFKDFFKEI